jgi:hypothetical protein
MHKIHETSKSKSQQECLFINLICRHDEIEVYEEEIWIQIYKDECNTVKNTLSTITYKRNI